MEIRLGAMTLGLFMVLPSCQMSQQKSGHTGAAIGAVVGGTAMALMAKNKGASGRDLIAPAAVGAAGGGTVGHWVGQRAGMQGVYRTEVPNE